MYKRQIVRHKSRCSVGIASLVLALLIGSLYTMSEYPASAQVPDGQPPKPSLPGSRPAFSSEALQPFEGEWHFDSTLLTVGSNGEATFITRAYQFCRPGILPPCDAWQGNTIIPGIQEKIALTKISGKTAYGTIISSTNNKAQRQVTLTLQPHDTLKFDDTLLCGPKGPLGHCGV